jgi:hypothetical protein
MHLEILLRTCEQGFHTDYFGSHVICDFVSIQGRLKQQITTILEANKYCVFCRLSNRMELTRTALLFEPGT